jgi:hypothetical protein
MKHRSRYFLLLTIFLLSSKLILAQFQQIGTSQVWETSGPVNKIGVGNYTLSTDVVSALQVDGNLVNTTTGEVFRTDAPNVATHWRMLRGGNEFGDIYNNNDNHFYLQATNANGALIFNTGGATEQMRLAADGNLGIGLAAPNYLLDLDDGDLNLTDGIIRIADNNMVYRDGVNNVAFGI